MNVTQSVDVTMKKSVNISGLQPGLYILNIKLESGANYIKKVVKL